MKTLIVNGVAVRLQDDEKLVVINDVPKYVVREAQDVIACIQKYTDDNGLKKFQVQGAPNVMTRVQEPDLVRLTITSHTGCRLCHNSS